MRVLRLQRVLHSSLGVRGHFSILKGLASHPRPPFFFLSFLKNFGEIVFRTEGEKGSV